MSRLYITVLALILLLGQWSSIDHAYHQHDSAEACDYCLSAQTLDHAATPATLFVFAPSFKVFKSDLISELTFKSHFRYFAARAPPRFI